MEKMSLLDKLVDVFTTNRYLYTSSHSIETLRSKIKFLINQEEIFDFKYNLTGNLNPDDSFKLVRKLGMGRIQSWDREPITISGKLIRDGFKNTKIEMEIKPNFIFLLFSVLFGVIGIGSLISSLQTHEEQAQRIGGMFSLVFPVMWGVAWYTKNFYKAEFERALDLQQEKIPINRTVKF
ncbi:MAG: hypothetical protein IPH31_00080 [Lewinellaceae bacterium]|nr:hypothetical protein [Lewinellaceae bacterium]